MVLASRLCSAEPRFLAARLRSAATEPRFLTSRLHSAEPRFESTTALIGHTAHYAVLIGPAGQSGWQDEYIVLIGPATSTVPLSENTR